MKKVIDLIKEYDLNNNLKEQTQKEHSNLYVISIGFYTIEIREAKDIEQFMHSITVWNNKPHNTRPVKDYKNYDTQHFILETESTFKKFIRLAEEDKKNKVVAVIRKSAYKDLVKELPELFERNDVIITTEEDEEFDKMIELSENA